MEDTIAAISTAIGEGGIAIIRVSGPQALDLADRIFLLEAWQTVTISDTYHPLWHNRFRRGSY